MKLDKDVRTLLYKAARKKQGLEIDWPLLLEPRKGHSYKLEGTTDTRLLVEARSEAAGGRWKAVVRLDHDRPRPLRLKAKKGLEANPMGGPQFRAELEPEQVDARYQSLLDEEGRQKSALLGARGRERERISRETRKGGNHSQAFIARAQRRLDAA